MNYWLVPRDTPLQTAAQPVEFHDAWSSWSAGEEDSEPRFALGDTAYLVGHDGKLFAWGTVLKSDEDGRIVTDDDEEGQTPPWWVDHSASVKLQPKVVFGSALPLPEFQGQLRALSADEARAIDLAIRRNSEPRVICLDHVSPRLIKELTESPERVQFLDWRNFEYLLEALLDQFGYRVDLQRGTKDGGVDLFALSRADHPFGPHKYLLQAKKWKNAVGVAPVRELKFLHDEHRMTKSCLVTTSRFTSGAWRLAKQFPYQLELRDFEGFQEWIRTAWEPGPSPAGKPG